ncbi:hypothetical protein EVAR_32463_1 [Eumeta japonica]|uniref:Uncharacterized protein n=1 Tax=Eumeta variegata TaxID=151549 RepID=A0A4C1VMZ9_EUMVA|nr:hypothetical protein EVAR_32463_1 [Eumeta japonica]
MRSTGTLIHGVSFKDRWKKSAVRERCSLRKNVMPRRRKRMLRWFGHLSDSSLIITAPQIPPTAQLSTAVSDLHVASNWLLYNERTDRSKDVVTGAEENLAVFGHLERPNESGLTKQIYTANMCDASHVVVPLAHFSISPLVTYTVPSRKAGNALVAPLRLQVSMGGGDHLLSGNLAILFY